MTITTDTGILHLLQLSSSALPVGGYSFSQGLEYAIEAQWVSNKNDLEQWLTVQMNESIAWTDLPLLSRLLNSIRTSDIAQFKYWNATILACRETSELRFGDIAMGNALVKLLKTLDIPISCHTNLKNSFASAFASGCAHWRIDIRSASSGYVWAWLENQVAAALKLMPIGQTQAQQLLNRLIEKVPKVIDSATEVKDAQIGGSLPAVALASSLHETQYTRIFRS